MRSARASSVREAERRKKAEVESLQQEAAADRGSDRPSLTRQERLNTVAGSAYEGHTTCRASPPSVLFTSTSGVITTSDDNQHWHGSSMNTLAAQTHAGTSGSSYSINKLGRCDCNHSNQGNHVGMEDDNVFVASYDSMRSRQEMRWELQYFFMNPYLKYKKRGRKPWKLGVQLLKIVFVTLQLILFGTGQRSINDFYEGNKVAFEHLFLKDWDPAFDSKAYPRSNQLYAIYTQNSLYNHLEHVAQQFATLESTAIGTYAFDHTGNDTGKIHIWQQNFEKVDIFENGTFSISRTLTEESLVVRASELYKNNITVKEYLDQQNQSINTDTLRMMKLKFVVSSVHLRESKIFTSPDCIMFNITIVYDNSGHNGKMPIRLSVEKLFIKYIDPDHDGDELDNPWAKLTIAVDVFVIILCAMSACMCIRSFVRAQHMKHKTVKFFEVQYNHRLSTEDRLEFLNLWYVLILASDVCTMAGSITKVLIEFRSSSDYNTCSLLLGMGCFFVWFGVLRYLGFFSKYNILIITLKSAMPNVLRFLLCTGIIYAAYAFFGWIVLGPYHPKFKSLDTTVECMFSLLNGDDMYATFAEMDDNNTTTYVFSKIYLYTFISLFIYVVLSLIIAVIMDTYETIKEYQRTGYVEGRLQEFMAESCDENIPGRGSFHTQSSVFERRRWKHRFTSVLCCKRCRTPVDVDDDDSMIT